MAFTIANWTCVSTSLSSPQETITPFGGSPTVLNAPNLYTYGSPIDTIATILAANYFLPEYASLGVGDIIIAVGTDASTMLQVLTVSSTGVTTGSFTVSGVVGTANITNNAVTFAKMQQIAATSLLGNATGGLANVEDITLGNGLSFAGTVLQLDTNFSNYVEVSLSAAQFNGMYAAPVALVAASGANTLIVVDKIVLEMTFGSADFAAGGPVAAQYGSTIHGAGPLATNTEAAADFFAAASTSYVFGSATGNTVGALPFSTTVNTGIFLSNTTAAFTTGDSTFTAKVWYKIIPTNS